MIVDVSVFKHGLFYYSCAKIKNTNPRGSLYYDNKKTEIIYPESYVIHARSFNKDRSMKKLYNKIKKHKGEINNDNVRI